MNMNKPLRMILRQPLYPWLVGVFPVLHFYTENLGMVIDAEVLPTILFVLAGTSIIFMFCKRRLQDIQVTALFTSLCSIVFSLSGHVYVEAFMPRSLGVWTMMLLLGLAVIGVMLSRTSSRANFAQTAPAFNLIILALVSIQVIRLTIGLAELSKYAHVYAEYSAPASEGTYAPKIMDSAARPDIYFIIPDGYSSDAWLKATANFDNFAFTGALEDRGFAVVDHAQSNYPVTLFALASTLNMRYYSANPSQFSDEMYLKLEAADSKVSAFLLDLGYTYIQLLTNSLLPSPKADIIKYFTPQGAIDVEVDFATLSGELLNGKSRDKAEFFIDRIVNHSFYMAYFDTTLLRLASHRLLPLIYGEQFIGFSDKEPEKFLDTIDEAIKISEMPEATFTIIHLMKPHQPVVFNEQGEHISWIRQPTTDEFGAQLRFINSRFLYLFDSILASSENPPVIIFQADHSTILGYWPSDLRLTYFDVYAGYYLPPAYEVSFPRPFTTVNTFALILNAIFGTEFELEDNRLFELLTGYDAPFEQKDVTNSFLNR